MGDQDKNNEAELSFFIRETEKYDKEGLRKLFGVSEVKLNRIIKLLRRDHILKACKDSDVPTTSIDLQEIEDTSNDIEEILNDTSGYKYAFNYVGLIIVGGKLLKCYPKYIKNKTAPEDEFKQVLKVITKYGKSTYDKPFKMFGDTKDGDDGNLLAIMLFLLNDYYENGVYRNEQLVYELNGQGEILWDRTVNQTYPILQDGYPIYTDFYTKKRMFDEYDYFTRLHKYIITECSDIFKKYKLFDYFDGYDEAEISEEEKDSFGDSEYVAYRIDCELGRQFNSRKQLVLEAIKAYLLKTDTENDIDSIEYYGTKSFNLVWEKVCGEIFNNLYDCQLKKLKNALPLQHAWENDITDDSKLKDIIEKPAWVLHSDNKKKYADNTLNPDIITSVCYKDDQQKIINWFLIMDAKYYNIQFEKDKPIAHQPGIGDVTKQFLYQLAYNKFIQNHGFNDVKNCFIIPTDEIASQNRGYVEMLMFTPFMEKTNSSDEKNNPSKKATSLIVKIQPIQILMLSAQMAYDYYLEDDKVEPLFLVYLLHKIQDSAVTYEFSSGNSPKRIVYPQKTDTMLMVAESSIKYLYNVDK